MSNQPALLLARGRIRAWRDRTDPEVVRIITKVASARRPDGYAVDPDLTDEESQRLSEWVTATVMGGEPEMRFQEDQADQSGFECHFCSKVLPTERGRAVHEGRVHGTRSAAVREPKPAAIEVAEPAIPERVVSLEDGGEQVLARFYVPVSLRALASLGAPDTSLRIGDDGAVELVQNAS